jgi:hypothetical protein
MPDRRRATNPKLKHYRLWPLMLLPLLGLVAGQYLGNVQARLPFAHGRLDPMSSSALGLLAGSGLMVVIASAVLAYRVAQRRFTIGAILVTIAVVGVLLGGFRAILL